MRKRILPITLVAGCTLFTSHLFAQMPNYMPAVQKTFMNSQLNQFNQFNRFMAGNMKFNYSSLEQGTHFFVVVKNDSTVIKVFGTIRGDSLTQYLQWKDKTVSRNDSGRLKKIYPNQTKEIIRIDQNSPQLTGFSTDTCWLFKAISGKITCYSPVADDPYIKDLITYIQKENGPILRMTSENLESLLNDNEKALGLLKKKKFERAIAVYNRSN